MAFPRMVIFLFHEDVNSKAMVDMQNNEYMPLGGMIGLLLVMKESRKH